MKSGNVPIKDLALYVRRLEKLRLHWKGIIWKTKDGWLCRFNVRNYATHKTISGDRMFIIGSDKMPLPHTWVWGTFNMDETRLLFFFLCDKSIDIIQEVCKGEKKSECYQHNCCADGTGQQEPNITGRFAISKCTAVKQIHRINEKRCYFLFQTLQSPKFLFNNKCAFY